MYKKPLAAVVLSGLITSVLSLPTAAGAATISKESPPQTVTMQSAKLETLTASSKLTKQNSVGYWVTVQQYPSPYGSLYGISRIAYGNAAKWSTICAANKLQNCNLVYVGQRIYVPDSNAVVNTPQVVTKPAVAASSSWVHPLRVGNPTSSCFGMRWGTMHKGIDYPASYGTPIRSVGSGVVVKAGWIYSGYGISIFINHGNGFYTHYAHASRLAVRTGQRVAPGQTIAYVGSTGDSTGNHLHFEVHELSIWHQINPGSWLRARGVTTRC